MKKKCNMRFLTALLCAGMLFGAGMKMPVQRVSAAETFPGVTTPEPMDPDAGFGDLPEPPSAADAKEDVEDILAEVETEKEAYREETDVRGVRTGMLLGGIVLIGICGVAVYYFKFKK